MSTHERFRYRSNSKTYRKTIFFLLQVLTSIKKRTYLCAL